MPWTTYEYDGALVDYFGLVRVTHDIITVRMPWGGLGLQWGKDLKFLYSSFHGRPNMRVLIGARARAVLNQGRQSALDN